MIVRKASYSQNLNAVRHSRSVEETSKPKPQAVGLRPNWGFGCKPTACSPVCIYRFYRAIIPTGFYKKQALGRFADNHNF